MRSTIAEMGVPIFSPCSGSVELWNGNIIIKSEVRHFSIMCQKQRKWWDQKTCDFSCLEEHFLQDKKNHKFSDLIIYRMCAKTNHHHHHRYHHSLYRAVISTNLEDRYFFITAHFVTRLKPRGFDGCPSHLDMALRIAMPIGNLILWHIPLSSCN